MEFGVHLPLLAFRGQAFSLSRLVDYAETAEQLGFTTLCANDHLITSRPWLDSLTALASILTRTPHMTLMTTVALPVNAAAGLSHWQSPWPPLTSSPVGI